MKERFLKHDLFGIGLFVEERQTNSGLVFDVLFQDGLRSVLADYLAPTSDTVSIKTLREWRKYVKARQTPGVLEPAQEFEAEPETNAEQPDQLNGEIEEGVLVGEDARGSGSA